MKQSKKLIVLRVELYDPSDDDREPVTIQQSFSIESIQLLASPNDVLGYLVNDMIALVENEWDSTVFP